MKTSHIRIKWNKKKRILINCQRASLTVEAALVLPLFIYFMLAFLYFLQILTVQERIQATITQIGMSYAKAAYVYKDFPSAEEVLDFDFSVFVNTFELVPANMADGLVGKVIIGLSAQEFLDNRQINNSCIVGGFNGLSFTCSGIISSKDDIDIEVRYRIKMPVPLFALDEIQMVQRVRLRKWTGYEVPPAYHTEEEKKDDSIVYVTQKGTVYHTNKNCSHIKLSIKEVSGIPEDLRNDAGAKYYPCEVCCSPNPDKKAIYYITSDGTRFHSKRDCSGIKRTVKEIKLSEVGERKLCKRCEQK
jgi:hypothetical protein